ncbi:hypothetical protein WCE41_04960 [Luteimonas sp. MJ246]|uniref:hypothetical protein n=1 Tax=Luteimonas sp. MJ174 TaxID=3129237 RepID=UPI0031B9ED1D
MKPSNRIPLIVAGVVVLAVVAGTFVLRGRDTVLDPPEAQPVAGAPIADATGDAVPAGAAPVRAAQAATSPDESALGHVERRKEMRESQQARIKALREESAQRFASEQVDPAWAPAKIEELTSVASDPSFAVAEAEPQQLSVDCRSSTCRIDGQFETASKAEDWILMYMSSVGSRMPNSVVSRSRNADGSTRVEIYGRGR